MLIMKSAEFFLNTHVFYLRLVDNPNDMGCINSKKRSPMAPFNKTLGNTQLLSNNSEKCYQCWNVSVLRTPWCLGPVQNTSNRCKLSARFRWQKYSLSTLAQLKLLFGPHLTFCGTLLSAQLSNSFRNAFLGLFYRISDWNDLLKFRSWIFQPGKTWKAFLRIWIVSIEALDPREDVGHAKSEETLWIHHPGELHRMFWCTIFSGGTNLNA